jgi:hypothetical protein
MDRYTRELVKTLKPLIGNSAGLMVLREMKELGYGYSIEDLKPSERETLANRIIDHIVGRFYSPARLTVYRSKLYMILGISSRANNIRNVDSLGWT